MKKKLFAGLAALALAGGMTLGGVTVANADDAAPEITKLCEGSKAGCAIELESASTVIEGDQVSVKVKGNVKARARMIAQYAIAGDAGLLVIGTDHGAESVTGFFTKFGDGGADLLPLYGLNKRQIRQLLQHLGAPEPLWQKVPTADLLDGKPLRTDEDELGIAYDEIDDYLEGREVPVEVAEKIEQKWFRSRHKRATPASLVDEWWR